MLKQLRKLLLKSAYIRHAVADCNKRLKEQRRQEHLVEAIWRGGTMR